MLVLFEVIKSPGGNYNLNFEIIWLENKSIEAGPSLKK
jgi:hypothetical protein